MSAARKLKVTGEEEVRKDEEQMTDANRLRLALWYIGKCGSLEDAERAFSAAAAATRQMAQ